MKLGLKKLAAVASFFLLASCAWYQKHDTQIGKAEKDQFACILAHAAAGDDAKTIAASCGGLLVTDVIDVLLSVDKAGFKAPHYAAPAPSASASGK